LYRYLFQFEHRVLWSSIISGLMIIASMVFATLTVRLVESRQIILISVLSIIIVAALYIGLPLVAYRRRDVVFATVQLMLCFIIVLISYCQRAFDASEKDSSNISLVPSSTGQRSQQPYWVDTSEYHPNAQKHYDEYHLAATMTQRASNEAVRQDVAPGPSVKYGQSEYVTEEGGEAVHARL
ncbi:hypothetical protein GCK32_003365, partial [Trichostrongylus colubriformis]